MWGGGLRLPGVFKSLHLCWGPALNENPTEANSSKSITAGAALSADFFAVSGGRRHHAMEVTSGNSCDTCSAAYKDGEKDSSMEEKPFDQRAKSAELKDTLIE
ncbi:hypothetical protein SRHO_G00129740 [Serrasalmus rhombeus]